MTIWHSRYLLTVCVSPLERKFHECHSTSPTRVPAKNMHLNIRSVNFVDWVTKLFAMWITLTILPTTKNISIPKTKVTNERNKSINTKKLRENSSVFKNCMLLLTNVYYGLEIKYLGKMFYLSVCSFQVLVCWAASPWCCWCKCWGCLLCCCSCWTSTQHGGTVAENRGVKVSKRVSSTKDVKMSRVSGGR